MLKKISQLEQESTEEFGHTSSKERPRTSSSAKNRRKHHLKIDEENQAILEKLLRQKATYDNEKLAADERMQDYYRYNSVKNKARKALMKPRSLAQMEKNKKMVLDKQKNKLAHPASLPPINEGLRVTESLPMAVINSVDANDAIPLGSRSVASLEPLQGYEDAQDGESISGDSVQSLVQAPCAPSPPFPSRAIPRTAQEREEEEAIRKWEESEAREEELRRKAEEKMRNLDDQAKIRLEEQARREAEAWESLEVEGCNHF
jgi:hypothetical protein